ncbi:MAG: hypothetical protein DWQ06_04140 [Calditrichaeota bacterium]|nr:MAG: hypothetical protein DWQ06_04140 [Calditrichota bacterium]
MSKKAQVITEIFKICRKKKDYTFHNDLVKKVSQKVGFGNPFDATKIDDKSKLPEILIKNDYALIHLGKGFHSFIKGIDTIFHTFEPIQKTEDWSYRKSVLNHYNTSESNVLSVANNQRILHRFVLGKEAKLYEMEKSLKTYFPHRTKIDMDYSINGVPISLDKMQIEIDLTIEMNGIVSVFEAKNGNPNSFVIYQLYHPFLYYHKAKNDENVCGKIDDIVCVYLTKTIEEGFIFLNLWAYTFEDPFEITSIKFLKSCSYKLIPEQSKC